MLGVGGKNVTLAFVIIRVSIDTWDNNMSQLRNSVEKRSPSLTTVSLSPGISGLQESVRYVSVTYIHRCKQVCWHWWWRRWRIIVSVSSI